jgi:hypothetical protein
MRPTTKDEMTWADNHGYWLPPNVSAIMTDVVDPMMRIKKAIGI